MKPSVIAQRTAQAQAQIVAAVTSLAAGADLDASSLMVTHREPSIQALLRWEALATFLMALPQPGTAGGAKPKRGKANDETQNPD